MAWIQSMLYITYLSQHRGIIFQLLLYTAVKSYNEDNV